MPNNPPVAAGAAVPVGAGVLPNRPPGLEAAAPNRDVAPVFKVGAVLVLAVLVDPAAVAVAGVVKLPPPNSPPAVGAAVEVPAVPNPNPVNGFGAVLEDAPPNKFPGVAVAVAVEGLVAPKRPVLGCWAVLLPLPLGLVLFEVGFPKPANPKVGGFDIIFPSSEFPCWRFFQRLEEGDGEPLVEIRCWTVADN